MDNINDNVNKENVDNDNDNTPIIPPNFVTILDLRERWLKRQEEKRRQEEEEAKTINKAKNVVEDKKADVSVSKSGDRNRSDGGNKQGLWRQKAEKIVGKSVAVEDKGAGDGVANERKVQKEKRGRKWGGKLKKKKAETRAQQEAAPRGDHAQAKAKAKGVKGDHKGKAIMVEEKEKNVARGDHAPRRGREFRERVSQALIIGSGDKVEEKVRGKSEAVIVERKILTVGIGNMRLSERGSGMVGGDTAIITRGRVNGGGNEKTLGRARARGYGGIMIDQCGNFIRDRGESATGRDCGESATGRDRGETASRRDHGKSGTGRMVWLKKGGGAEDHAGGGQQS